MWNPWDLTLGQHLSIFFLIIGFLWAMRLLLDELRRIREAVEEIRYEMRTKAPAADPLFYRDPDAE